jgi:hypothetical protein
MERKKGKYRDPEQIIYAIKLLLAYPQLDFATSHDVDKTINWQRMQDNNEVVYVYAPTLNQPTASYAVSAMAHSYVNLQMDRVRLGLPIRHGHLFIDEPALMSEGTGELLGAAAKYHVSFHLTCQTSEQIEIVRQGLRDVFFDNTFLKLFFTPSQRDEEYLQFHSDEVPISLSSSSAQQGGLAYTTQKRELLQPRLAHNTIIRERARFGHAILLLNDSGDFHEPYRVRMEPQLLREVYQKLRNKPLPTRPEPKPPSPLPASKSWAGLSKGKALERYEAAVAHLYARKRLEELGGP